MFGLLLALAQVAVVPPAPRGPPTEVSQRLELGFKLCARHLVRQGSLAPPDHATLQSLGVRLLDDVPDDVRANGNHLFPKERVFARIGQGGSNVYVSTANPSIACRVIVADTREALAGRLKFVDDLRATTAWVYDQRRSGTVDGIVTDELVIRSGLMIAIVKGPNTVVNDGKGIQVVLTVALLPPKAAMLPPKDVK